MFLFEMNTESRAHPMFLFVFIICSAFTQCTAQTQTFIWCQRLNMCALVKIRSQY